MRLRGLSLGIILPLLFLSSFNNQKLTYEQAFAKVPPNLQKQTVLAGIVPHHFLAKEIIAGFFAGLKSKNVKTIIIISPDHLQQLANQKYLAATSWANWQTPYGQMNSNAHLAKLMVDKLTFKENNVAFLNEHGISTLVPFAKRSFPYAQIVPLILKSNAKLTDFERLGKKLAKLADRERTLLIISSDFSHHVSAETAAQNDRLSRQILEERDFFKIANINCDCRAGMALLFGYLSDLPVQFKLNKNTTSFDLMILLKPNLHLNY